MACTNFVSCRSGLQRPRHFPKAYASNVDRAKFILQRVCRRCSETVEDHLQHLQQIFNRLEQAGQKLHREKYSFARPRVLYLGHVISSEGIYPNLEKIQAVKEFPVPTNVKAVREFLGLASY